MFIRTSAAISLLIVIQFVSTVFANAQGLCKEACYRWCAANRPTEQCRGDCVDRSTCTKSGYKLSKSQCYEWCKKNKPGQLGCLGDCDGRK